MMICALRGTSIDHHSPHVTCASNSIEPEVFDLPRNQHRKQALAKAVTSDHAAQRIVAAKVERIEWCAAVAEAKRKVKDPVQRACRTHACLACRVRQAAHSL